MSGLFISLDGIDGGGKSTQVSMLCDWFAAQGRQALAIRDPGGTQLGEALREVLLHRQEIPLELTAEMLLYMASRAQLVAQIIRPALAQNKVVVSDRYLLANIVYQGFAGGLAVDDLWQIGKIATGGLEPQLTIVLDLDAEVARQRLGDQLDRLESRGLAYMQQVRQGFLAESQRMGSRSVVIDATQGIDAIHRQVVTAVQDLP